MIYTYKDLQREAYTQTNFTEAEYIDYKIKFERETGKSVSYIDEQGLIFNHLPINYFPELKEYEIWMQGYKSREGETIKASLVGKCLARNFIQAVEMLMCQQRFNYIDKVNHPEFDGANIEFCWTYDAKKLTLFGNKLFWSEKLARMIYG